MTSGAPRLVTVALPLALWAVHFVVAYAAQGTACARGLWRMRVAGLEGVTWGLLLATAAALAAVAWLATRAHRVRVAALRDPAEDALTRRTRFLSTLALLVAAIAAIAIVFTTLPILLLPTCR